MASGNFFNGARFLLDYIFPHSCLNCYTYTLTNNNLCATCFNQLSFITKPFCKICGNSFEFPTEDDIICIECLQAPSFDKARHLLKFDRFSKPIIHAFKYFDKTAGANYFANLLCNQYKTDFIDIDIITCVPMNRLKRLIRMYNHSQILGESIAIIFNKQFIPDLLIKTKWTKSQTSLTKKQREYNLDSSLIFNIKYTVDGKKILVVDDVITTKNTITKCSNILKNSGASYVYAIAIAATYKL